MAEADETGCGGLAMVASALAGRAVAVSPGPPGSPPWTDGETIYVDPGDRAPARLQAVALAASMIAAGSFAPEIVAVLVRRRRVARRYLAVEGQRALLANRTLLPGVLATFGDGGADGRSRSAAESLAIATGTAVVEEPPDAFGTIRPRRVLALQRRLAAQPNAAPPGHVPRREDPDVTLDVLDEGQADDTDGSDPFTSPVGGGGFIGTWFAKLLSSVRKTGGGGGSPGADNPTHRVDVARRGARAVTSLADVVTEPGGDASSRGCTYPEWDAAAGHYREQWCTVREIEAEVAAGRVPGTDGHHVLRRPLARLGMGLDRRPRQPDGDEIDVDAAIAARVDLRAGSAPDDAVYTTTVRRRRDLSVLVLLDVSGSAGEPGTLGRRVHEHQRDAAAHLVLALHELGDRVALYGYFSQGRKNVTMVPVKRFDEHLNSSVMRRLHGLEPGAFSRLGAAIRHGATVVERQGGTPRRVLVVVSDGLAYDHGYERAYGAADARRALDETRRRGTGCVCLTVGAHTDVTSLRRVFGSSAHAAVGRADHLAGVIGPLLRSALRGAEAQRRNVIPAREGEKARGA